MSGLTSDSYELWLYDTGLLSFELIKDLAVGYLVNIKQIGEPRSLFPLDLEVTEDGIWQWLERRVIPKNRAFVQEILKTLGLRMGDTKGIIDVCKGLSLNDSYWVVPEGFKGNFAEYNL